MKALIIEDTDSHAQVYADLLAELGFKTVVQKDGRDGYNLLLTGQYDLAIVDIDLPHMKGSDIVIEARQNGVATPILCVSEVVGAVQRAQDIENGANDHMAKPCHPKEFKARVKKLLLNAQSSAASGNELHYGDIHLNLDIPKAFRNGRELDITPLDINLLECMIRKDGFTVPYAQIRRIYGLSTSNEPKVRQVEIATTRKRVDRLGERITLSDEINPIVNKHGAGYAINRDLVR